MALSAASLLLLLQAPTLPVALVFWALYGLAEGVASPTSLALLADHVSPGRRGRAIGLYSSVRMSGYAGGAILGALLLRTGGLAALYLAATGAVASSSLLALLILRAPPSAAAPRPRLGPSGRLPPRLIRAAWSAGLLMLTISFFIGVIPSFRVRVDSTGVYVPAAYAAFLVCRLLLQPPAGLLGDRRGHAALAASSLLLMAPLMALLAHVATGPELVVLRALQGAVAAGAFVGLFSLAVLWAPAAQRSVGIATVTTGVVLGAAFGPLLGGLLASLWFPAPFYLAALLLPLAALLLRTGTAAPAPAPHLNRC